MTTLYRSVLIESAEQAEALPVGTVATHDAHMPLEKWSDPEEGATWGYLDESIEHADLVGWTALVPIEAEEEWTVGHEGPAWAPGTEKWAREFQTHEPGRRLFCRATTPWEEA